jgi:hypothetical protein
MLTSRRYFEPDPGYGSVVMDVAGQALAGSRRALAQAVRTPGAGRRHTALTHRLHPPNSCRLHVNDTNRQYWRVVDTNGGT